MIDFFFALNKDCTSRGTIDVRLEDAPAHGTITIRNKIGTAHFAASTDYFHCNGQAARGVKVFYTPDPGYAGSDSTALLITFPPSTGVTEPVVYRYQISVGAPKSADAATLAPTRY
jgi:hypothetical protein